MKDAAPGAKLGRRSSWRTSGGSDGEAKVGKTKTSNNSGDSPERHRGQEEIDAPRRQSERTARPVAGSGRHSGRAGRDQTDVISADHRAGQQYRVG